MSQNGDILEIKLRDMNYNPILKIKAHTNNEKEMRELMEQLHSKGVHFPIRWFE